jgi:predicted SAM-dependent methyltransferase
MILPEFKIIPYENRIQFLRQFISPDKLGIEIGPSHAPIASQRDGYNTIIIDACSTEELQKLYKNIDIAIDKIETVNYIWRGEPLSQLVTQSGDIDYILASHVIEHIPNFVDFFQQSNTLLDKEGQLILAIPDKRKCFDYFRPINTTGQVLQSFHENRRTHVPASIFDNHANYARYKGVGSWFSAINKSDDIDLDSNIKPAYQKFLQTLTSNDYNDAHGWVFTPASFLLIIHDLTTLGLFNLNLDSFCVSEGHEFYAIFKKKNDLKKNRIYQWTRKQLQNWVMQNL